MRLVFVSLLTGSFTFHGEAIDKIRLVIVAAVVLLGVQRREARRERQRLLSEPVRKRPPESEPTQRKPSVPYP